MSPGVRFADQVDHAIAVSDAVLVVIGPAWLTSTAPDGGRRIDRPDDFVRREVGAALVGDVRVVPVLVDGAALPSKEDLPDDLVGLVDRQAVSLRDASWHQDVDQLVRHLRGESTVVLGGAARRRRRLALGGVALVAALIVIGAVVVLDGGDHDDTSNSEPAPCPVGGGDWVDLPIVDDPFQDVTIDGKSALVEILGARALVDDGGALVVIDLDVQNVTDGDPAGEGEFYYSYAVFVALVVDGVAQDELVCQESTGEPQLAPGRRVIAQIGYQIDSDPTSAELSLDISEGGGNVPVSDG